MRARFLLLLFLCGASGCSYLDFGRTMDLSGVWELRPGDYGAVAHRQAGGAGWREIEVPVDLWTQEEFKRYRGAVTLRTRLPAALAAEMRAGTPLTLNAGNVSDVSRFYLNGRLLGGMGRTAPFDTPHGSMYLTDLPYINLAPGEEPVLSVVLSSAGQHPLSLKGPVIEIGRPLGVYWNFFSRDLVTISLLVVYFFVGLFHLLLFAKRPRELYNLWFGLFCIAIFLQMTFNTNLRHILWQEEVLLRERLDKTSLFALGPLMLLFLSDFFFGRASKLVLGWTAFCALCALAVYFVEIEGLRTVLVAWEVSLLVGMGYMLFLVVREALRKRRDAYYLVAGLVTLCAGGIHDIVRDFGFIHTPFLTEYAFAVFILGIAGVVANRFMNVYNESDRLNRELKTKNRELTRLDRLKDDFLANTSHELRTPLNGIIGLTESLIDAARTNPAMLHNLEMIKSSGKRLAGLVDDILDFSRLQNADLTLQLHPVDLRLMFDETFQLLASQARQKGIELRVDLPAPTPAAWADENRLQQILLNLAGNAVKFTGSGSVTLRARQEDEDRTRISVIDTGIGIAPENRSRIFESFEQADGSINRNYGGTGLGLSIARRLVELHGARIELESEPGRGSVFSFWLPARAEAFVPGSVAGPDGAGNRPPVAEPAFTPGFAPTEDYESEPAAFPADEAVFQESPRLRIGSPEDTLVLVIDDEPVNAAVVENYLKDQASVVHAADGPAALEKIRERIPDLVLLDLMMPGMSGYEVCTRIREDYPPAALPVIVLSARSQVMDIVRALSSGANDYLVKPFNREELLARMSIHLELRRSLKEHVRLTNAFHRFVPTQFLDHLGRESVVDVIPGDSSLRTMSVLFSDIRSFTSLSEAMSPEDNFKFLNTYLKRMEPAIIENGGFVDKYIGDAIMALFSDVGDESSADLAVAAALEMRHRLAEYNRSREARGYERIEIGIAINSGNLMLGTVGSENRLDTTVIGNTVNLASRLESLTAIYRAGIIVSSFTRDALEKYDNHIREIDLVQVRGKTEPVTIFEIFAADEPDSIERKEHTLADFNRALGLYRAHDFRAAANAFGQVIAGNPEDTLAQLYLDRCQAYAQNPPPPNWDGVLELREK